MTISNRLILNAAMLASLVAGATAQKYEPPPPPLTTAPCKPTKKAPCAPAPGDTAPAQTTNPFPFPGDTPPATDTAKPAPASIPFPGEPAADPAQKAPDGTRPAPTQGAFPFPGDPVPDIPGAESSSSGESSSSSSSSADDPASPTLKDEGSAGSTRFSRKKLDKQKLADDPDTRETKDLEVSHYYATTGNFQASYLRAKDAVAQVSDDPAAHLALAQAAQQLKKNDEAVAEYNATLKLDTTPDQLKAARKGLADLDPKRAGR